MQPVTESGTRTWALRAAWAVASVGVIAAFIRWIRSDDEAPIRVRNGSIEIEAGGSKDNEWAWVHEPQGDNVDPMPSYSHEPKKKYGDSADQLWVKVTRNSGACSSGNTARGKMVRVEYSEGGRSVTFKRGKSGGIDWRTKVRRPQDLTLDSGARPPVLRHGTPGVGFIKSVRVSGGGPDWSCTFDNGAELNVIEISSRPL